MRNNKALLARPGLPDLNDLYLFARVVEHGSFTAAGRAAGLTTSRVSRRIADLEQRLGVRLLHRTTRKLVLTPVGEQYYQHCRAIVSEAESAAETIAQVQAVPRGRVRVTCPALTAQSELGPILTDFMRRYPEVQISLLATDRLVNLIDEGIDVAIRFRAQPLEDSSLVVRTLGRGRIYLVASPALLDLHGRPAQPAELDRFASVGKSRHDTGYAWQLTAADGRTATVPYRPRLDSTDWLVLRQAVLDGIGIAALPDELCQADLEAGRLEMVLPDWHLPGDSLHIIYISRRGLLPAVRAFIDHAAERLSLLCEKQTATEAEERQAAQ